jgi:hypothetical protein
LSGSSISLFLAFPNFRVSYLKGLLHAILPAFQKYNGYI